MGVLETIVILIIIGIVLFGFLIPSGLLSGSLFNAGFWSLKQGQTDIIEKQEAEKNKIVANKGEVICNLKLTVSGYFEIATKDLLTIPTKVTAYMNGKDISYTWTNCRTATSNSSPNAFSLLSLVNNLNFDVYGGSKPVALDLTDQINGNLQELSVLPVSGSTDLEIRLISSDGKFVDKRTYPSLSKTMTVNGQTPIQFKKEYYLDGLANKDYRVEISFIDMSINEGSLSSPYNYDLKKCSSCKVR